MNKLKEEISNTLISHLSVTPRQITRLDSGLSVLKFTVSSDSNTKFVIRLYPPDRNSYFKRERAAYEYFSNKKSNLVPKYYGNFKIASYQSIILKYVDEPKIKPTIELAEAYKVWLSLKELSKNNFNRSNFSLHSEVIIETLGKIHQILTERDLHSVDPIFDFKFKNSMGLSIERWLNLNLYSTNHTLIHGDFYPENILFEEETNSFKIIDWEYASLGDPNFDLCYFMLYSLGKSKFSDPIEHVKDKLHSLNDSRIDQEKVTKWTELVLLLMVSWFISAFYRTNDIKFIKIAAPYFRGLKSILKNGENHQN